MNYLILAVSIIRKILEEDPNLNKSFREKAVSKGKIFHLHGKSSEQKKKNWLSKYKF